jgi:hypothetical protein
MRVIPAGSTEPEGGGGGGADALTVSVAEPDFVSLVAVICVDPLATAVTMPESLTVAIEELADFHATDRSLSSLPLESRTLAVARVVSPAFNVEDASDTLTVATGGGDGAVELLESAALTVS